MNLGKTIYNLRKQYNMTQEELATRLGVSPQAVSKWENEFSYPDISLLPEIAKEFNITVDALLNDNVEVESKTEDFSQEKEQKSSKINCSKIRIVVDNKGKITNVSVPIKLVNVGIKVGGVFGGLADNYISTIQEALKNGLDGEIMNIDGENGENIRIILE